MRCKHSNVFSWHLLIGLKFNQEKGIEVIKQPQLLERATKRYREEDVRKEVSRFEDKRETVQCSVLRARKRCIALTSCYLAPHMLCFTKSSGLVAQLVRAPPCHGGGRGFESHPGRLVILWDLSSAGRASALQAEGHRFEPYRPHRLLKMIWCRCGSIGRAADL